MEEDNATMEEEAEEERKDNSADSDNPEILNSAFDKTQYIANMFDTVMKQMGILNEKLDSHLVTIDEKTLGLKSDISNTLVEFKKEVTTELKAVRDDIVNEVHLKLTEMKLDKTVRTDILPNNLEVTADSNQIVFDVEPCKSVGQPSTSTALNPNDKVDESDVVVSSSLLDITSLNNSLPNVTESSDRLNPLVMSCAVLPQTSFQTLPILTVAPAHVTVNPTPIVQSPVTRALRTLKPKPTTAEFIGCNFDADYADQVTPTHVISVSSPLYPSISGGPRTRGGLRREPNKQLPTQDDKNHIDANSARGARRGRKPKQFTTPRRQSERLKKMGADDSPLKDSFQKTMQTTSLEEFIWGDNEEDSKGEQSLDQCSSDKQRKTIFADVHQDDLPNSSDVTKDSTPKNDEVSKSVDTNNVDQIVETNMKTSETSNNKLVASSNKGIRDKTGILDQVEDEDEHASSVVTAGSKNIPKSTPRNLPVQRKKGLSLSSPRKGSHVRALDFATPIKNLPPRKANTSPKAVSQVKLAQMRSLRRGNLFKTPVKKKQSWDADLRAFVEPDLPITIAGMRKRIPPKKPGRPHKFFTSKPHLVRKNKKREKKVPKKKASTKSLAVNKASSETSVKSTDELVKQIESDVLEVIAEENVSIARDEGSFMDNSREHDDSSLKEKRNSDEVVSDSTLVPSNETPEGNNEKKTSIYSSFDGSNKTPAKLDVASLLGSNMMTPITKILTEESSLLNNIQLLTPGFLPTPDGQNSVVDVRAAATPAPPKNTQIKDLSQTPNSDSNQSIATPVKECSVRIEEALAAEEEVVRAVSNESDHKSPPPKPENSVKKKTPLKSPSKNSLKKEKIEKKKSKQEIMIDKFMKEVGMDLFGKSPKKKLLDKCKKNQDEKVNLKEGTTKKKSQKMVSQVKPSPDIKLPSFEEMMARLNKMNSFSSSSSDCSDSEVFKSKVNQTSKSLPKGKASKSQADDPKGASLPFTTNKPAKRYKMGKQVTKSPSKLIKSTKSKEQMKESSPQRIQEQIKDFSTCLTAKSSMLSELTFEYFDEGKNGDRTVQVSPFIKLFDFPLSNIINKNETIDQGTKSGESSKTSQNTKKPVTRSDTSRVTNDPRMSKKVVKSSSNVDVPIGNDPSIDKFAASNPKASILGESLSPKSDNKKSAKNNSSNYSKSNKDESFRKMMRLMRSHSREPRHSVKLSKIGLASHRSRLYERAKTPIDTAKFRRDTLYKKERAEEYRRRTADKIRKGREQSPCLEIDTRNRSPSRERGGFKPNLGKKQSYEKDRSSVQCLNEVTPASESPHSKDRKDKTHSGGAHKPSHSSDRSHDHSFGNNREHNPNRIMRSHKQSRSNERSSRSSSGDSRGHSVGRRGHKQPHSIDRSRERSCSLESATRLKSRSGFRPGRSGERSYSRERRRRSPSGDRRRSHKYNRFREKRGRDHSPMSYRNRYVSHSKVVSRKDDDILRSSDPIKKNNVSSDNKLNNKLEDYVSKHSKRKEEERLESSTDKRGDKAIPSYYPVDPRITRNQGTYRFNRSKPLAESTPLNRKKDGDHILKESNHKSARKYLAINKSDSVGSKESLQCRPHSDTEEGELSENENVRVAKYKDLRDSKTNKVTYSDKKTSGEPLSSPIVASPASPPTDPRLVSKTYIHIRSQKTSEFTVKHSKRKSEELEEGELSDESVSTSDQQSQLWIDCKKRKLSDIGEVDDST